MKLKPFGIENSMHSNGYTLNFCIGWLEALADSEEESLKGNKGPKHNRLAKVQDALSILNEAADSEDD